MSEEKFTVVKFTTHDNKEFYQRISASGIQAKVQEVVDRTQNVFRIDVLEMTAPEYGAIPLSSEAVSFFGAPREDV